MLLLLLALSLALALALLTLLLFLVLILLLLPLYLLLGWSVVEAGVRRRRLFLGDCLSRPGERLTRTPTRRRRPRETFPVTRGDPAAETALRPLMSAAVL